MSRADHALLVRIERSESKERSRRGRRAGVARGESLAIDFGRIRASGSARLRRALRRPCDGAARRQRPGKRCRVAEGRLSLAATLPQAGHRVLAEGIAVPSPASGGKRSWRRPAGRRVRPCGGRSDLAHTDRPGVRVPTIAFMALRSRRLENAPLLAVESNHPARGGGTIGFVTERSSGAGAGAPPPGRWRSCGRRSSDEWFRGVAIACAGGP